MSRPSITNYVPSSSKLLPVPPSWPHMFSSDVSLRCLLDTSIVLDVADKTEKSRSRRNWRCDESHSINNEVSSDPPS